jgi:calcineurin-like phosphoesterase family protein
VCVRDVRDVRDERFGVFRVLSQLRCVVRSDAPVYILGDLIVSAESRRCAGSSGGSLAVY